MRGNCNETCTIGNRHQSKLVAGSQIRSHWHVVVQGKGRTLPWSSTDRTMSKSITSRSNNILHGAAFRKPVVGEIMKQSYSPHDDKEFWFLMGGIGRTLKSTRHCCIPRPQFCFTHDAEAFVYPTLRLIPPASTFTTTQPFFYFE